MICFKVLSQRTPGGARDDFSHDIQYMGFYPEEERSMFPRNSGKDLPVYKA
jgi:hypothetical protein